MPEHPPPITTSSPAPDAPPADQFVRFVRAVEGKPVTRFVTGPGGAPQAGRFFGAERIERKLVYDTEAVHAITADEWDRYGRIYERNIRDGDLVEVDRKAFEAFRARKHKVREQAVAKADAEAKAEARKAEAAAKAAQGKGPAAPAGGEVS